MPGTDEVLAEEHCVPLTSCSAERLELLVSGEIPYIVAINIRISPDGAEQVYSLQGLTGYRDALAQRNPRQILSMLEILCRDAVEYPQLMGEALGLFAEDRLFWDDAAEGWRYLALMEDSAAWQALPDHAADEIWSALFVAAMEAAPESKEALMAVVDSMADNDFSVEELCRAITEEMAKLTPEQDEPEASSENEEEEEYRPWERDNALWPQSSFELSLTETDLQAQSEAEAAAAISGESAEPEPKELPKEQVEAKCPEQPVIPGVAPPPPPSPPGAFRSMGEGVLEGTGTCVLEDEVPNTTILGKPETSVLSAPPVGGQNVIKAEVVKIRIPRVVRLETKEMAYVDRANFVIGSKPGAVDFLIRGSRVISRRHAAIVTRGQDYYLVDLGSRNGVFVGSKRIPQGQETPIYVGDVFTLANEKFKLQW